VDLFPRERNGRDELAGMRDMVASLPVAIAYLAGRDHVFEFVTEEFRQLIGGRDVLGLPAREALPELAGSGRFELMDNVLESGRPVRGHEAELSLRRFDGDPEQVYVDFIYQPVRNAEGTPAGLWLFTADVTANVRDRLGGSALAAQLLETQERYRTLFQTLPEGVIYYAADGLIMEANPAAREILGIDMEKILTWPLPTASQAVHEDGSPFKPEELPIKVALRTGNVVVDVVMGVQHGRTDEQRWLRITAVPDARDADGRPQRAYAMFRDLTDERRVAAALREGAELMGRLRDANVLGVGLVGEDDGLREANDAYLDIIGYTRDDLAAGRIDRRTLSLPQYRAVEDDAMAQLRRSGACRPFEKEYQHRDGHRVPVLIGAATVSRKPLRWVSFVVDLTARQRAERERAEILARERVARSEADNDRERLTFLLRAGSLVAAAQDRHELLERACQVVVDSLADFCMVFLPDGDGLRATAIAYRDPARGTLSVDLSDQTVPAAHRAAVATAYATGTSQVVGDVSAWMADRSEASPMLGDILAGLETETVLAAPLMVDRRPLGVLAVGRSARRPGFAETDIAVIEELSRRVGVGLANADTFARDHSVAETLQRSVLPDALPSIAGLDLAVRYIPGTDDIDVGGDWYDAFALDDGQVGLVIGDVVGHSITSASIMGQVRNLLRAYAIDQPDPSDVLARTNGALGRLLPEAMATAVYAVLDLANGDLRYANAGHPPPVCATGADHIEYLDDAIGTMLGAASGGAFTVGYRRLAVGARLLFYTDGLIERRRQDIAEGFGALADAMRGTDGLGAERTCAAVQRELLSGITRADDVCLLAAGLTR
jgi:PAS domain S-box-containing protein